MSNHPPHILELAKKGATHKYQELKAEIAALVKAYPHLRFGSAVSPAMPDGNSTDTPKPVRQRRKMSAAARKRISDAQKKRWAAARKTDKA